MPTIQLEHAIKDFEMWKAAFDRDPIGRRELGVRRHTVLRPVDDPTDVVVELDFDTIEDAEACRAALGRLWASRSGSGFPLTAAGMTGHGPGRHYSRTLHKLRWQSRL